MIPLCSRADGLVLRANHQFVDACCRFCGAPEEVRVDMLALWRAMISTQEPEPPERPRVNGHNGHNGNGCHTGARLPEATEERIREMLEEGAGIKRTAREVGVSRQAVRRRVADMERK
jgi:hypothetical protein